MNSDYTYVGNRCEGNPGNNGPLAILRPTTILRKSHDHLDFVTLYIKVPSVNSWHDLPGNLSNCRISRDNNFGNFLC